MPRLRGWLREPVDVADGREVFLGYGLAVDQLRGVGEPEVDRAHDRHAGLQELAAVAITSHREEPVCWAGRGHERVKTARG
jgi:hypothetical protein